MKKIFTFAVASILTVLSINAQAAGKINNAWIEYSTSKDGENGMTIHTDFSIEGMQNKKVDCTVWFYDEDKNLLKSYGNDKYNFKGSVVSSFSQNVTYDSSHFSDWDSFIPYRALYFKPGRHTYYWKVVIYDNHYNILDHTELIPFTASGTGSFDYEQKSDYQSVSDNSKVDNSEKIHAVQANIIKLKAEKDHCAACHGTGQVPGSLCMLCNGTGTMKVGYRNPQYFFCNSCNGKGRMSSPCTSCRMTDITINVNKSLLKTLKETHGMTWDEYDLYLEQQRRMAQMDSELREAINSITPTRTHSTSTPSSSSCSICGGSGIDPFAWESDSPYRPSGGGYTNSDGNRCPYCYKTTWHQHKYCPKCRADRY